MQLFIEQMKVHKNLSSAQRRDVKKMNEIVQRKSENTDTNAFCQIEKRTLWETFSAKDMNIRIALNGMKVESLSNGMVEALVTVPSVTQSLQ